VPSTTAARHVWDARAHVRSSRFQVAGWTACPPRAILCAMIDSARTIRHVPRAPAPRAANDAARDPYVERAIAAMTADPARAWTLSKLARVAGLSRAPLSRRFQAATGTSPLRWLRAHRLSRAERRLVETDMPLAVIADEVGYASEFAFAKAFKRRYGVAPGLFRRGVSCPPRATALVRAAA
jgi:AraC-like DNA-binding protein